MPITRSQKSSRRREQSTVPGEDASASASGEIGGSRIVDETETGSASAATEQTQVVASALSARQQETVGVSDEPVSGERDTSRAVIERNPSRPVSMRSTTSSIRKRRDCQARIELARKEFEIAQQLARKELEVAQQLAQKELQVAKLQVELAQLDEEDDEVTSDAEEPDDRENCTREWVETTVGKTKTTVHPARAKEHPTINRLYGAREEPGSGTGKVAEPMKELSEAIKELVKVIETKSTLPPPPPSYMLELPYFDGNRSKWLAFETVYEETAPLFSSVVNMTRLRKALKGAALVAVESLLYSKCEPKEVIEALQRRFGRPEAIVMEELEKLRSIPKMNDNMRDLCVFASQVNNAVAAIRGLGQSLYLHSPETVNIIVDKMPALLKKCWCDFLADNGGKGDPHLIMIAKFLNREADRWGQYTPLESVVKKINQKQATHTVSQIERDQKENSNCPHCEGNHYLSDCRKFQQASVDERWDIAKSTLTCFKCLRSTHRRENCRKPGCKTCKGCHHSLLHVDKGLSAKKNDEGKKEVTNNITRPVNSAKTSRAYLKMVPVELFGPKGSVKVLALLDDGSTVTLLDSAVAKEIGVQGTREPITVEAVGGKIITMEDSVITNLKIKGLHQKRKRNLFGVRTIDEINLTPQGVDKKKIEECAHLRQLAEELSYEEEKPRLLIGQDNWQLIVSRSMKKGKKNQPVASFTYLGWVLHGSDGKTARVVNIVTCAHVGTREQEAVRISKEVDTIHKQAGLVPTGWASNTREVLGKLAQEEKTYNEVELGSKEEKTLGLRWLTEQDEMGFRTSLRNIEEEVINLRETPTKREITSAVMSTFDPMGLVSPVLIQGKWLFQDIWRSGIGWYENIELKEEESWKAYVENLQLLRDLRILRCITHSNTEGELHNIFTDASETVYACAVHWRQKEEGKCTVALIAGKARVAPLKPISIPRLELQAALLGTRMAYSVEEELDLKVKSKTYWTDSSTVLSWIKADPRTFKSFVAHRLAEIEDTSRPLVNAEENTEEEGLTPNHSLIRRSCGAPKRGSFTDAELRIWKVAQRLADHFWSRWVKEYLPTLLPRKINGRKETRDIQSGDIVLIVDSTLPRCTWPRGQVVGTYPGPDGRTRVLDVRTVGGVLKRPCSKVVLLIPREADTSEVAKTGVGATHEGEDVGDGNKRK